MTTDDDDQVMVPITRRILAALGRVPKVETIGDSDDTLVLQAAFAQWRAIVDPLPAAPGSQLPLETRSHAAPTARIRKAARS